MYTNNPFHFVKINNKKIEEETLNEHIPLDDQEGQMATSELNSVIEYANEILKLLKPETQMEAWVQSKITKAKDYLDSVADYLKHTDGALEERAAFKGKQKVLDADGDDKITARDFKLLRQRMKKKKGK